MKTSGSAPASPVGNQTLNNSGLSKREFFAAMAMQGMYNNGVMRESGCIDNSPDGIAEMAVNAADELIKALNNKPE